MTRLDSDAEERLLVAVDLNRAIFSIDLPAGRILDRWDGRWLDAAAAQLGSVALDRGVLGVAGGGTASRTPSPSTTRRAARMG